MSIVDENTGALSLRERKAFGLTNIGRGERRPLKADLTPAKWKTDASNDILEWDQARKIVEAHDGICAGVYLHEARLHCIDLDAHAGEWGDHQETIDALVRQCVEDGVYISRSAGGAGYHIIGWHPALDSIAKYSIHLDEGGSGKEPQIEWMPDKSPRYICEPAITDERFRVPGAGAFFDCATKQWPYWLVQRIKDFDLEHKRREKLKRAAKKAANDASNWSNENPGAQGGDGHAPVFMTPAGRIMLTAAELATRFFPDATPTNRGYEAGCPTCGGETRFKIETGADGFALYNCFSGCEGQPKSLHRAIVELTGAIRIGKESKDQAEPLEPSYQGTPGLSDLPRDGSAILFRREDRQLAWDYMDDRYLYSGIGSKSGFWDVTEANVHRFVRASDMGVETMPLRIIEETPSGGERAAPLWLDWNANRRTAAITEVRVVMDGEEIPSNVLPQVIELPKVGQRNSDWDFTLLNDYFLRVLANGNEPLAHWIKAFCADMVQNPMLAPQVALALVGSTGSGKTMLSHKIMRRALGAKNIHVFTSLAKVVGGFNYAALGRILLHCDETADSFDTNFARSLKSFITEPLWTYEEKFAPAISTPKFSRVITTSNEATALNLDPHDRRWTIVKTPLSYTQAEFDAGKNREDFDPLMKWIEANDEAIAWYFANYEFDRETILRPAITSAHATAVFDASAIMQVLRHIAVTGILPGNPQADGLVTIAALRDAVIQIDPRAPHRFLAGDIDKALGAGFVQTSGNKIRHPVYPIRAMLDGPSDDQREWRFPWTRGRGLYIPSRLEMASRLNDKLPNEWRVKLDPDNPEHANWVPWEFDDTDVPF